MLQQDKQSLSLRAAGLRIPKTHPLLVLLGEYKVTLCNNMCEIEPGEGGEQSRVADWQGSKFVVAMVATATMFSHLLPGCSCGSKHLLLP